MASSELFEQMNSKTMKIQIQKWGPAIPGMTDVLKLADLVLARSGVHPIPVGFCMGRRGANKMLGGVGLAFSRQASKK